MAMSDEVLLCTICRQPLGQNGRCQQCDPDGHLWTIRDWRPLVTLGLIIALGFSFTRLVVVGYEQVQRAMALRYYTRGTQALSQHRAGEAVRAFESALVYSHENLEYRLKLTDALLASGAAGEARAQLRDYRAQHPEDAMVNLKLARLEAESGSADEALHYYRNAIDGAWPGQGGDEAQKTATELEVAEYLTRLGRKDESEGVLVKLMETLPSASPQQANLAALFLRNGDAARALEIYEVLVLHNHNDRQALLGAARAEVAAGNYVAAKKYVAGVIPADEEAQKLQAELDRTEALDPFAKSATSAVRAERTIIAYQIAIKRLAACGAPFALAMTGGQKSSTADSAQWTGFAKWAEQLQPLMEEHKLHGRDDIIESAMRFVFQAEATALKDCAPASLDDEALRLLGRERMGASQ
jgi:tetratricopeptide (TPR) repeat protein